MRNFKISQKILKNIKGEKVMDVITDFQRSEIDTKEHYEKIIHFITSYEIRKGKFKGNKYIIEKINRDSFILYIDDGNEDITRNIIEYLGIKNLFIKSVGFFKNKGYCNVLFDKLPKLPRLIVDITSPLKSMLNV